MSQGARSAGAIGWPSPGPSAPIAGAANMIAAEIIAAVLRRSCIGIGRLPFLVDPPGGDGIVVIEAAQPAFGGELRARRLHHAGVVGGTALQDRGTAVPAPGRAE